MESCRLVIIVAVVCVTLGDCHFILGSRVTLHNFSTLVPHRIELPLDVLLDKDS